MVSSRPPKRDLPHAYPTAFVGRSEERQHLLSLLRGPASLVTVLGPGGMGKTRLAVEVLHELESEFDGHVWFRDMSEATTLLGTCSELSLMLGAPLMTDADASWVDRLGRILSEMPRMLVVFDNFERAVQFANVTISAWRRQAPNVSFLVTSRERLRVQGEVVFDLGPLTLPAGAGDATEADASKLFLERARAVRRGFEVAPDERDDLAAIVRALDGMPLAIELAAARLRVMSLKQLREQLANRFELLASPDRDRSSRQQTLEGAIAWSWDLLSERERTVLAHCSVFRGGFDLDAAVGVVTPEPGVADGRSSLLNALEALQDKSLLRAATADPATGVVRFALYEGVRDFAFRELSRRAEGRDILTRHAEYFARVGRVWAREARGAGAVRARAHLSLEMENVVAAQGFVLSVQDDASRFVTLAIELALALEPLLSSRGPRPLLLHLLESAVNAVDERRVPVDDALFVEALVARARIRMRLGKYQGATQDAGRAEALVNEKRLDAWRGRVLRVTGEIAWLHGDIARSVDYTERAAACAREAGDRLLEAQTLRELGQARAILGQPIEAGALLESALRLAQELEEKTVEAATHSNLGMLALHERRTARAREHFEASIRAARQMSDVAIEVTTLAALAETALDEGNLDEAAERFADVQRRAHEIGLTAVELIAAAFHGSVLEERGDVDRARQMYRSAAERLNSFGNLLVEGLALGWLGRLEAEADDVGAAERLLDAATEKLEVSGDRLHWEVVSLCRGHLELALARQAERAGQKEEAAGFRRAARERAAAAKAGQTALSERSVDVRIALRILERALAKAPQPQTTESGTGPVGPTREAASSAMVIASTGRWFRTPAGLQVNLETRGSLRLLLRKLVESYRASPGTALDVEELFQHGWPGERAVAKSASNRVYVAISTLRTLGLRQLLRRRNDGYMLDPNARVEIEDEIG